MTAMTIKRALTRRRRNWVTSSANNIETLSGQGYEGVLEGGPGGRQAAYAHPRLHQGPAARLGQLALEAGRDLLAFDLEVRQAETLEYHGRLLHIRRLHRQPTGARGLQ